MNQIAQNKNNYGDNSLNMQSNSGSRVLAPLKRPGQGKIGDYADLEKLNGNFDLLDAMDAQVNGYTWDTIDKHDWTTWPAWMVREIGHTDNRRLMNHIDCDCGSCEPAYDEMRDEAYCNSCGFIAGQRSRHIQFDEDFESVREAIWENDPEVLRQREEDEYIEQWIATPEVVTQERKPQKRNYDNGKIYILWVHSNEEITTEDPITGETITETVKVQLKVATDDDSWEAINPVTGKMDTPDGITYLGRDQLVIAEERAAKAREFFEIHNETCMVGNNHGHPDNCRECRRLYKRMMKKGAELKSIRDRLTLQV